MYALICFDGSALMESFIQYIITGIQIYKKFIANTRTFQVNITEYATYMS